MYWLIVIAGVGALALIVWSLYVEFRQPPKK